MTAEAAPATQPVVASPAGNGLVEFDFTRQQIKDRIKRLDIPAISPEAYMILKSATTSNSKYRQGQVTMSSKRISDGSVGDLTYENLKLDREDDRVLYPKHVVVGFGGIFDKHGQLVKHTQSACEQLFKQLPDEIFEKVRAFCLVPSNFYDVDETVPDAVAVAGN